MQIIGIDLGFSPTESTNCYCAFKVNNETKEIGFLFKPTKFNYLNTRVINLIRSQDVPSMLLIGCSRIVNASNSDA